MMDTVILLHAGGGIAMTMAGIGMLKFFLSASDSVQRIPAALERSAEAEERQAVVAEQTADLTKVLHDLQEGQEQIRITNSVLAMKVEDLARGLNGHSG